MQKSGPLSSYDLFLGVFSMSNTILVDVQWLFWSEIQAPEDDLTPHHL